MESVKNNSSLQLKLLKSFDKQNVVFSPLSIYFALALTSNGAKGDTQSSIIKLLEPTKTTLKNINNECSETMEAIKKKDGIGNNQIIIANSIFTSIEPEESFKQTGEMTFDALIDNNFNVDSINKWCSKKTNGKIKKIISNLSKDDKMVILNAVYFNGTWVSRFEQKFTKEKNFYNGNNKMKVRMMTKKFKKVGYSENKNAQIISLPYSDKLSAIVILPQKNITLQKYIDDLTDESLSDSISSLKKKEVTLFLPKFKIETSTDFNKTLKNLGMGKCFDKQADFSGITKQAKLFIKSVIQKAFIDVNEAGTEAAAVTAIKMLKKKGAKTKEPPVMNVERPFLFMIKHSYFDNFMFITRIENIKN